MESSSGRRGCCARSPRTTRGLPRPSSRSAPACRARPLTASPPTRELRLLDRLPDGAYTIGTGLWELGELAPVSMRLRERALPHVLRLYEASGENVHVAVLSDEDPATAEALYVARVTGPHSIPTLSRMGGRHPLHTTGVGKALLAQHDDDWLDLFFHRTPRARDGHSIIDERPAARRDRVGQGAGLRHHAPGDDARQRLDRGAHPARADLPPAAVGVVTHLARADERRLGPLVVAAARDIARDLADPDRIRDLAS